MEVLFQIIPFVVGHLLQGGIVKNPSKYEAWTITCNLQANTKSGSQEIWHPFELGISSQGEWVFCSLPPAMLLYQSIILLNCAMDYNWQSPEDKGLLEYSTKKRRSQTSQELGITQ